MTKALCTFAWLMVLLVPACTTSGTKEGADNRQQEAAIEVVAEVGDRQISLPQLQTFFSSRIGEFGDQTDVDALKSRLLEDLIEEELLDQEAEKENVPIPHDEVQLYLRELEAEKPGTSTANQEVLRKEVGRTLRVQKYIRERVAAGYTPAAEEIQKYYADHAEEFQKPETVRMNEILLSSADHAERIMALLKASQYKNFSQLARLYSTAPTAAAGGEMGLFARGDLPEEMEKVLFQIMVPGKVSPIIQTKYGYHIFQLVERRPAGKEPFEQARERIATRLQEEHQKKMLEERSLQLKKSVPVHIYRRRLDFSYNGSAFSGGTHP